MGNQMVMRKKEYEYDGPGHINLDLMAELKAHLKDQGFRQQEIANLVGVTKSTISMQLAGTRTMSVAVYMKIAEYTGFTPTMFRQTQTGDEIRMDLVQNRELFAEILRKLYKVDRAGVVALAKLNTYLDGLTDGQDLFEKKNY
jgi:transcriptional regulator with XRE-family HTH domain